MRSDGNVQSYGASHVTVIPSAIVARKEPKPVSNISLLRAYPDRGPCAVHLHTFLLSRGNSAREDALPTEKVQV